MLKTIKWLLLLVLLLCISLYVTLHASLPELGGNKLVAGLEQAVDIERDSLGTAIIRAQSRRDAAFGLGYAHGQDRFFQMDLLRRNSAGELAELFGDAALKLDERHRFHQFRKRAQALLKHLPAEDRAVLEAYSLGVNQALSQQALPGFEYLLSGGNIQPWQPEDSLLTIFSMYLDLQGNTVERELVLERIKQLYGDEMLAFVSQNDPIQAALDGSTLPTQAMVAPTLSAAALDRAELSTIGSELDAFVKGSNNWAVTGHLTQSGHAMLSDDMHLGLAVPIIWYRAQLNYPHTGGDMGERDIQVTGVSLPGAPVIVVGTNGHIAWGFTNGYIDTADWIELAADEATETVTERLDSTGAGKDMTLRLSRFGPVKHLGDKDYALSWVAHGDFAINLNLMHLETATGVGEGLELTRHTGIPVQNMLIVDEAGNAAWRLTGAISARDNPTQTAQAANRWQANGWAIPAEDVPIVSNPTNQRLWSANSRVLSISDTQRFGDGGYAIASRAAQIRDNLLAKDNFDERDFLAMQLDNRALFLTPWHQLLTKTLKLQPDEFADDLKALANWGACACSESVGYTLVSKFRIRVMDSLFAPLQTRLAEEGLSLSKIKGNLEVSVWQLLRQQPDSWLPENMADWDSYLLQIYRNNRDELLSRHSQAGKLADLNWGKVNALKIQHPFSKQIPLLAPLLDMPQVAGFGGHFEPAVQSPGFGASQRLIVQPGRESNGILMVPGGQSGHPLSPYYRSGFDDYANHRPTPLLPGEVKHMLRLTPQ
ncbi:penicillin acylase family protein [Shewanella sp. FJAT-52076]|uniref:penicillin acylase family protein n=1 Tax=Shewanella sp. FJAT-52076 TaxID=2864202 RepID=UPI001C6613F3|nr:penicillin acylase family protein [Shewanella sp. FJAT-52076]QYJ75291.1 penicillin acylase family protein [Shewanella sp. FJAT-52076]